MGARRGAGLGLGPLDFDIWYFAISFSVEIVFFLVSELVKWKFTTIDLSGKILSVPPGKIHSWSSPEKKFSDAHDSAAAFYR